MPGIGVTRQTACGQRSLHFVPCRVERGFEVTRPYIRDTTRVRRVYGGNWAARPGANLHHCFLRNCCRNITRRFAIGRFHRFRRRSADQRHLLGESAPWRCARIARQPAPGRSIDKPVGRRPLHGKAIRCAGVLSTRLESIGRTAWPRARGNLRRLDRRRGFFS